MEKENISISLKDLTLAVNDLALAVSIIDVASKRGAFEGKDLSTVGQVRDNIKAYVDKVEESLEGSEISEDNSSTDPGDPPSDTE
tara:strand:- start:133 stop:387 length:255 start_codon:yes stop_codon:yes gene_type:complete